VPRQCSRAEFKYVCMYVCTYIHTAYSHCQNQAVSTVERERERERERGKGNEIGLDESRCSSPSHYPRSGTGRWTAHLIGRVRCPAGRTEGLANERRGMPDVAEA
jgi:hypothetical protein